MPVWDFHCIICNVIKEYAFRSATDADFARCPECGGKLARITAAPNFTITGYTAKNGYSKT